MVNICWIEKQIMTMFMPSFQYKQVKIEVI